MSDAYTLAQFVADLRTAAAIGDIPKILDRLRPLAQRFAVSPDLEVRITRNPANGQNFDFQLLHEEPDHSLAVAVLCSLPGRGTPPHDHGTWGVVIGVEGEEINAFWRRTDNGSRPGYARLEQASEQCCARGDAITLLPDTIHSVQNETGDISVSLHVYGRHVDYTERFQFDIGKMTATPWQAQTWQPHPADRRIGRR
jgi:predicted metal-dependent enzyme (double-stranded beta helix superfamily)